MKSKEKSLEAIDKEIIELSVEKSVKLDKLMSSNDPHDIIKANNYISTIDKNDADTGNYKVFLYSPEREFYTGLGYKSSLKTISYDVLRRAAEIPSIYNIISTRCDQVSNYLHFSTDEQKEGWTIRPKLSVLEDRSKYKLSDADKKEIDRIVNFINFSGENNKWDINDDLDGFVRKWVIDSLTIDQACAEFERNRKGKLVSYTMTDSGTMRYLETIDPAERDNYKYDLINNYRPYYAQVYNSRILNNPVTKEPIIFYPWELSFSIRNRSSSLRRNSYGKSEVEILIEVITWLLWGMQYNGNFFKQGSAPRGFLTLEGNVNDDSLTEMRQAWRSTVAGVQNAHKIPIFRGSKDSKVTWNDMHVNNKDMEYQQWNDTLTLLTCSVFHMDPSELGFRFKNQGEIFGQDGQKQRTEHSKNKGLKPILTLFQKEYNKYVISELNDKYEFVFTGIDLEDQTQIIDNDVKKLNGGLISIEDAFEKYNNRKLNPEKDTLVNSGYLQSQQAKMFGGQQSNDAVNEMSGEDGSQGSQNPFEQYEKAISSNPIFDEVSKYINKEIIKK